MVFKSILSVEKGASQLMSIQDKFDQAGRVALVTGGAGLLGVEFCRTSAEAGAAVAVVDIDAEAAAEVAAALTAGLRAQAFQADVTDPSPGNAGCSRCIDIRPARRVGEFRGTRSEVRCRGILEEASRPAASKISRSSSGTRP